MIGHVSSTTLMIVGSCFLLLLTPLLITSHHMLLIVSWNAYVTAFFLPGQPYIWMPFTLVSAFCAMALRNLVHCALCLALSFLGVAGLFLHVNAGFVAFAQILVYVGAVA